MLVTLTWQQLPSGYERLAGAGPVPVEFTDLAAGVDEQTGVAPWNQACVAVVKETPALINLQRKALSAFLGAEAASKAPVWAPPLQKPHLSLAYSDKTDALAEFTLPAPFVADSVAAWHCEPHDLLLRPTTTGRTLTRSLRGIVAPRSPRAPDLATPGRAP